MQRSWEAAAAANDTIVPFTGWAKPDLSIVEARRAPPELPLSLFGNAAGELAKLATDKGGPLDYVALSWLAVCASLVGSKRKAVPYEGSSWEEPSILWLGLVGDPSHNKSPSLDPFMKILRKMEEEKADEHEEALSVFKADAQRAKVERGNWERAVEAAAKEGLSTPPLPDVAHDPKEPVRRRYYVQDTTPESMAGVLVGNPEGTLMFRDELAGWFSSFDRYNPGGRTYWLEAYGGRPYTVDRKGSPVQSVCCTTDSNSARAISKHLASDNHREAGKPCSLSRPAKRQPPRGRGRRIWRPMPSKGTATLWGGERRKRDKRRGWRNFNR